MREIDLDEEFDISAMKDIIYNEHDEHFYVMANKLENSLGFYLIKFHEDNPVNQENSFLMRYKNKLEIGDCRIRVMHDEEHGYKELVISYKTIYINTYTVHVMDLTCEDQPTIFRHESFQLWESESRGILLRNQKDFLKLSKTGANILALGHIQKRKISDKQGHHLIVHSLESMCYLKLDNGNSVLVQCADGNCFITIVHEYSRIDKENGDETMF